MGSEVCPFCGKTYKRLKSHLPHCKVAASSRTPPAQRGVPAKQTPPPGLAAAPHKSKDASAGSSKQQPPSTPAASVSSPPSAKKTKQKLSEQIMASAAKSKSLRALTEADTKVNPDHLTQPRDAPKKDMPQIKRREAAESLCTTKRASDAHAGSRNSLCVDSEGEAECLSVNKLLMKSRRDQGRITVQDVKATLSRTKASRQRSVLSIMSHVKAAEDLSLSTEQASLIPLQHASPQPKLSSSLPPDQAAPLSPTVSMSEGLKVGQHLTRLLSVSPAPTHNPHPQPFQLAPPVGTEALRAGEGLATERLQLKVRKEDTAGALTQRRLGQVRLRELPEWLACRTPRTPRGLVDMVHRGWQWYHRRYIDVKRGGAGGVGMLLAGYCVLSYAWSYPHVKRDRWRKYH